MGEWAGHSGMWAGHNQHVGGAVYVKQLSSDDAGDGFGTKTSLKAPFPFHGK